MAKMPPVSKDTIIIVLLVIIAVLLGLFVYQGWQMRQRGTMFRQQMQNGQTGAAGGNRTFQRGQGTGARGGAPAGSGTQDTPQASGTPATNPSTQSSTAPTSAPVVTQ